MPPMTILASVSLALLGAILLWQHTIDTEALKKAISRTHRLLSVDTLTDLPNRSRLLAELTAALNLPDNKPAIMFIDLDNFQFHNEALGHLKGDELLKLVSQRFKETLTEAKIVARICGDEFGALMIDSDALWRMVEMAKNIQTALETPFDIDGELVYISASIGIASCGNASIHSSELLRRADVAMHTARRDEHCAYRIFEPEMDDALQMRRRIGTELDQALSNGDLELAYQPLVCARTGEIISAEALIRWPTKKGMEGSPAVFIPIAEETGLITKLGNWVLDQALLEIKRLGDIPIAINVSPIQFRVEGFADSVEYAIAKHDIDPKLLRIEITEGVLISHTGAAQKTMQRLREIGVQVLLDDFGTGYSSLSYLQQFEFDGLKIDRVFIQRLDDGHTGYRLLKSIIALGHSLDMQVIAEGVETASQASTLQLLRCDALQGYALGRPGHANVLRKVYVVDGDEASPIVVNER